MIPLIRCQADKAPGSRKSIQVWAVYGSVNSKSADPPGHFYRHLRFCFHKVANAPPWVSWCIQNPHMFSLFIYFCTTFSICSRSSRKRTPSGLEGVRNWSWPLTRMVLVSSHERLGVRDRWPLTGACPASNKHWECKKYHGVKWFFVLLLMQCRDICDNCKHCTV